MKAVECAAWFKKSQMRKKEINEETKHRVNCCCSYINDKTKQGELLLHEWRKHTR